MIRATTPEIRQFVEDMGLSYEDEGFPPMAGRLTGWLLICDPPHQTAGELAEALEASPGSISTTTRMLVTCGLVERISVPGQRGVAFRIRRRASVEILRRWAEKSRASRELAARGLQLLQGEVAERQERLRDHHHFHEFFEREIPALLERYERERGE